MKKTNIIQTSMLTALLAATPFKLYADSHLYNIHAINATIETLDNQSKNHNNYQELEQLCGSLKQQNQRQTMQLEDARAELSLMQARLEKQTEDKNQQTSSNAELTRQIAALNKEKNDIAEQLAQANQNTHLQKESIAKLETALSAAHEEKETLEMAQANLNQELLCAQQEIEKHTTTSQEYNQLKQQMAQAKIDLQFPHAQKIETLKQANIPAQQLLSGNKNS